MAEQTAGTTVGGNAAATQTTGTTADGNAGLQAEEREELERLRNQKEQWLAEKNERAQEQERLREAEAQLAAGRANPSSNAQSGQDPNLTLAYAELYQRAVNGDGDARVQIEEMRLQRQATATLALELAISQVPAAYQDRVRDYCTRTPGALPRSVYDAFKAQDDMKALDVSKKDIAEREARLKTREDEETRIAAARASSGSAGAATTRPVTGQELREKNPMKASQFKSEVDRLTAEGKIKEARALARRVETGDIPLLMGE